MDFSCLWGYVPHIIRLAEESLEVAFIVCNDDFTEFGWLEVFDAFNQTFTSAYVLGTGFWPFYQSTSGFCLCVCARFGLFCRHVRNNSHWLSRKYNKEKIFSSKYNPVVPFDYMVKVIPAFDMRPGYIIMISMCIQDANDKKTFNFLSRYEYITQLYHCYSSIIFNPHPRRLNTYGSYLAKLQYSLDKNIFPKYYNVDRERMPSITLTLKHSSLPLYTYSSGLTANLLNSKQIKKYKNVTTQTYWDDTKKTNEFIIQPQTYHVLPLFNNPWKVNGSDLSLPVFSNRSTQSVASSTLPLVANANKPPPSYEEFEENRRKPSESSLQDTNETVRDSSQNFSTDCSSDYMQSDSLELPLSISTIEDDHIYSTSLTSSDNMQSNNYEYLYQNIKSEKPYKQYSPNLECVSIKNEYTADEGSDTCNYQRTCFQPLIKTETDVSSPYKSIKVEDNYVDPFENHEFDQRLQFPSSSSVHSEYQQHLPIVHNFTSNEPNYQSNENLNNVNHSYPRIILPNKCIPPQGEIYLQNVPTIPSSSFHVDSSCYLGNKNFTVQTIDERNPNNTYNNYGMHNFAQDSNNLASSISNGTDAGYDNNNHNQAILQIPYDHNNYTVSSGHSKFLENQSIYDPLPKSRGRGRKSRNPRKIDVSPYRSTNSNTLIGGESNNKNTLNSCPTPPQQSTTVRQTPPRNVRRARSSYSQMVKGDQIVIDLTNTNNRGPNKRSYASVLRNTTQKNDSQIKSLLAQSQNVKPIQENTDAIVQQLINLETNSNKLKQNKDNQREIETNAILKELLAIDNEEAIRRQRQIDEQFEIAEEFIREDLEREAKRKLNN